MYSVFLTLAIFVSALEKGKYDKPNWGVLIEDF